MHLRLKVWGLIVQSLFAVAAPSSVLAAQKESIVWNTLSAQHAFGLYLSDPDGSNERTLLAGSDSNYNPSFSADGRWIVFTSERSGSADVFRVHADASGLERLTDSPAFDDQGALSPDGKTLAFVSTREGGMANIWLQDVATRRAHNLTRSKSGNFRPRWSPDGKWIAFSSDRDMQRVRYIRDTGPAWELMQTTAVYIVHPDGSGLRRLTGLDGIAGTPSWSRDGRRVIFAQATDMEASRRFRGRTQLVSIDIATGVREVHSNGQQYVWSPSYVTDTDIGYGVHLPTDQQGSNLTIEYSSGRQGPKAGTTPSWSPDGSLLVYAKDVTIQSPWMYVLPSRDARYESVGGSGILQAALSFTANGEQFVQTQYRQNQVRLLRWDNTGPIGPIVFDGGATKREIGQAAAVSADGKSIAISISNSPQPEEAGQIAVTDSDGSHFRVVTRGGVRNDYPSFSPDGMRLVYRVGAPEKRPPSEQGLRIVSLTDGKTVKLTSGWDNFPTWSPRGDRIAFTGFATGDFEIYTIRPDGTGLRQLTHTHGNDAHPVWSPDGKWITFASARKGWKDDALLPWHGPQTYGEVFVMRADGTDVRQLTDNQWEEGPIGWARSAPGR
jgi:Tol biopolymer transport system component